MPLALCQRGYRPRLTCGHSGICLLVSNRVICRDPYKIAAILSDESVFDCIRDDGSKDRSKMFEVACHIVRHDLCLMPHDGVLFTLREINCITKEWHSAVIADARNHAIKDARACATWVFNNTACQKIISYVPAHNRAAKALCWAAKMSHEGIVKNSFLFGGQLMDMDLFGLSKDDHLKRFGGL